jgi:hypothetical protein
VEKKPKSPQLKKELSFKKDHFTFAEYPHAFRRNWRNKKVRANRKYRRKIEQLLAPAQKLIPAKDAESVVEDLTTTFFKNSIGSRLRKSGTVTVGEKVNIKLEKRKQMVGRRVNSHRKYDLLVEQAVNMLTTLPPGDLAKFLKRAKKLLQGGDPVEWMRVGQSHNEVDRALWFLERVERGDGYFHDALGRNQQLCAIFHEWQKEANRILTKEARPSLQKYEEKRSIERRLKADRRIPNK